MVICLLFLFWYFMKNSNLFTEPFGGSTEGGVGEKVSIKAWLKQTEVLGSYACSEVMANGEHYVG